MRLILGNKLYSSWSMRPWLLMKVVGIEFSEEVVPLFKEGSKEKILARSPSGKVPCLVDGDVVVWESLAIMEYLAERFPDKGVWPSDVRARAHARAAASEMHAGFQPLRAALPMNLSKRFVLPELGSEAAANVARVESLWREARVRFAADGPFLYGSFCAVDAMFTPVVTRFDTYQVPVSTDTRAYMDAILALPALIAWRRDGLAEPRAWDLPHYEAGHVAVEEFARP
ncbi:MAG: glutathione S-transferase family protein [Hyphomicrobiaceae bacterium]